MNMRHGMPPILKMQSLGMEPSLSSDVECTLTADFFTQMRSTMNVQRALVNQMVLEQGTLAPPTQYPTPAPGVPPLLTTRDVLRYATINGAKGLRLDKKVGSLTPGKEADIIILDATAINVAPLNSVPGAVVSLMERSNVETVIVAGKVRKWKGRLLDANLGAPAHAARGLARLPVQRRRHRAGRVPLSRRGPREPAGRRPFTTAASRLPAGRRRSRCAAPRSPRSA